MIHYVTVDTNRYSNPHMYDSRLNTYTAVTFEGARSFLHEYINRLKLHPISIYESYLPNRTQIVCWYTIKPQSY